MPSPETSTFKSSIGKLKFISGAQVFLGVGIIVCAVIVTQQEDHYNDYYFGGFTCGFAGALAGIFGLISVHKAYLYNGDGVGYLRKESLLTPQLQLFFGFIVFMMSITGIVFNILFLVNDNDDDDDNDMYKTHVILSACLLSGIVILLLVTFMSCITICYQPKGNNQRINHPNYTNTVGRRTQNYQGQSLYAQQQVYSTRGLNLGSNPPPYSPTPPSFGIGQNPTQYGVQPTSVPTVPPPQYSYLP